MSRCAYLFLDEAGNFDFSTKGTPYFVLTSVSMRRPFPAYEALDSCKYDCLEHGSDLEYFHCSEEKKHIRDGVFDLIASHLRDIRIDCLVVEKRKTVPALRSDTRFYPEMLSYLLRFVLPRELHGGIEEVIVITDIVPVNKKRQAVEKGVQRALAKRLRRRIKHRILHHASRSHYGLQMADYCCWAVFRKWQKGDRTYYDRIKDAVRSEHDIFRQGTKLYY